jgi:hypothetical protein
MKLADLKERVESMGQSYIELLDLRAKVRALEAAMKPTEIAKRHRKKKR